MKITSTVRKAHKVDFEMLFTLTFIYTITCSFDFVLSFIALNNIHYSHTVL